MSLRKKYLPKLTFSYPFPPSLSINSAIKVAGAIATLKNRGGSSLQAIKKALGAEKSTWRFINAALKSGVAKGTFTKNGGKYKVVKVKAAPKKKKKKVVKKKKPKKKKAKKKPKKKAKKKPKKKATKKKAGKKKAGKKKATKKKKGTKKKAKSKKK